MGSISYGMLEASIHNVARRALKSGIVPGDVVATLISDSILHAVVVLGLMHAGATTLSLRSSAPVSGIVPDVVLTDGPGTIPTGTATVLSVDRSWIEGEGAPVGSRGNDDDICRIILTSGSTGRPKGIAFSHRALAARIAHYTYSKGPRFAHCSRFFCDLGISTSPGFRYAMVLLSRGGTIFFLGPEPADILQTIDLYKIQGMATSPYGLSEFLKFFEADSAFEVTFDHIICQGAMMSRQLSQRATRAHVSEPVQLIRLDRNDDRGVWTDKRTGKGAWSGWLYPARRHRRGHRSDREWSCRRYATAHPADSQPITWPTAMSAIRKRHRHFFATAISTPEILGT